MLTGVGLVLASCGQADQSGGSGQARVEQARGVERADPETDAPTGDLVDGLIEFGYELTRTQPDDEPNLVLSPTSVAYAFAMARAGAGGQTADELDAAFGFPADGLHPAVNALTADLVTTDEPPPVADPEAERDEDTEPQDPVVAIANGLFAQDGLELGEPFLHTLAEHYGSGVQVVDFADDQAIEIINGWVAEQTADRIDELFAQLPPNTRVVLANAIYLKADWLHPFDEVPDNNDTFTTADGSTVDARMLRVHEQLRYAETDEWQAVELPYAGALPGGVGTDADLVMRVFVPTTDVDPIALLAPPVQADADAAFAPTNVEATIPEWDFGTDVALVDPLRELGITQAFTPGQADFDGIFAGAFVGDAVHRANISVDRWGTEAAAATGIAMPVSAPAAPDATIVADRPFAFTITHVDSGLPLFLGQVGNPTTNS